MTINAIRLATALVISAIGVGCTTAYDAYGNPRPVVEPGVAILGAAAAGLLAYGLASDHRGHHHGHRHSYAPVYRGHGYYGRPAYYRSGSRRY